MPLFTSLLYYLLHWSCDWLLSRESQQTWWKQRLGRSLHTGACLDYIFFFFVFLMCWHLGPWSWRHWPSQALWFLEIVNDFPVRTTLMYKPTNPEPTPPTSSFIWFSHTKPMRPRPLVLGILSIHVFLHDNHFCVWVSCHTWLRQILGTFSGQGLFS